MTRIQMRSGRAASTSGEIRTSVSARPAVETDFARTLARAEQQQISIELNRLIEAVEACGQRLAERMGPGELQAYKRAIRAFFETALEAGSQVLTHLGGQGAWERKVLATIAQVDQELARLAELIHTQEKDRIRIVAAIDSIKGLLVDLRL